MKNCPICGASGVVVLNKSMKTPGGKVIGRVRRDKCVQCGEEFFAPSEVLKIERADGKTARRSTQRE